MFGEYKEFAATDGGSNGKGDEQATRQRSRSPVSAQLIPGRPNAGQLFTEPWSCEHVGLDDAIRKGNFSPETLNKMAEVPLSIRTRWIHDVIQKTITDPNAWIGKCYANYQSNRRAEQLTGVDRFGKPIMNGTSLSGSSPCAQTRANTSGHTSFGLSQRALSSPSHGGGRPSTDPGSAGGGEPPIWAKPAFDMWPKDKSGLVTEVCRHLNSDATDLVMELDAPSAAAMCFALVLAAPASEEGVSLLTKQWLQRRGTFKAKLASPVEGSSQALSAGQQTNIMFIIIGINDGRAAMLAHAASKIMKSQYGEETKFEMPVIIAPTALKEIEVLQQTCSLSPFRSDVTTMSDMEPFIERTANEWITRHTKFLVVHMLAPSEELQKMQEVPNSNGLHSPGARWIFEAAGVTECLCKAVGHNNVASIFFSPKELNQETTTVLKSMFGDRMENVTPCLNTFSNTPTIFAVPSGCVYQALIPEKPKCVEHDGWKIEPKVYDWATKNQSLGSQAVSLLWKKIFQERDWTSEEKDLMRALVAEHALTGEQRYISREWWMMQYGILGDTPMPGFYKSRLPCHGQVFATTGLPGKGPAAVPCGKVRYCENCEKLIRQLDQGYHFHVLVNAVTNVLTKALGMWKRGAESPGFSRPDFWATSHQCGDACAHATSSTQ